MHKEEKKCPFSCSISSGQTAHVLVPLNPKLVITFHSDKNINVATKH